MYNLSEQKENIGQFHNNRQQPQQIGSYFPNSQQLEQQQQQQLDQQQLANILAQQQLLQQMESGGEEGQQQETEPIYQNQVGGRFGDLKMKKKYGQALVRNQPCLPHFTGFYEIQAWAAQRRMSPS